MRRFGVCYKTGIVLGKTKKCIRRGGTCLARLKRVSLFLSSPPNLNNISKLQMSIHNTYHCHNIPTCTFKVFFPLTQTRLGNVLIKTPKSKNWTATTHTSCVSHFLSIWQRNVCLECWNKKNSCKGQMSFLWK